MNKKLAVLLAIIGIIAALIAGATYADAENEDKVTLCHAAGLAGTTHYETLEVGYPAAFGPAGHFFENGTPRAGHEEDYLGSCNQIEPTTTLEPTTTATGATTTTENPCLNPPCIPNTQGATTTTSSSTSTPTTSSSTSTTPDISTTQSTTSSSVVETTSTTTSSTTSSTTTLPETFTFGAAATVCVNEVPTIRIEFQNTFPQLAGQTGTLTMEDINGNVVSTQSLVYAPGTTVDILYPGTSVNADGSIDDVPGWILTDDDFWIRDPSDEFLREGINLTYTVNPTATAFITYPPESSACANPDGPFGPPISGGLPPTK